MPNFPEQHDSGDYPEMFSYWIICTLTTFVVLALTLIRVAENSNRLNYEDRLTRIIAGFLQLLMRTMHTGGETLQLPDEGASLIAAGPHRTSLEAIALSSQLKGNPPRFLATDSYNNIPGVSQLMTMFRVIQVKAEPARTSTNHRVNTNALDLAVKALNENGRVVLFPQGNFCYIDQDPPIIYSGAARLAIQTKTPIHVIRLDGLWSIYNPVIPQFIRNNRYYRAFLSVFHPNNIKSTLCKVIEFHLKNEDLPEEEKIKEINAQLYAFFRHTGELTPKQIENINKEIATEKHRAIWDNKFRQYTVEKDLKTLKEEGKTLEKETQSQVMEM